jgi:hypothetical protein
MSFSLKGAGMDRCSYYRKIPAVSPRDFLLVPGLCPGTKENEP